jgi:hypothetical protein
MGDVTVQECPGLDACDRTPALDPVYHTCMSEVRTHTCSRYVWNIDLELVRTRIHGSTMFTICSIALERLHRGFKLDQIVEGFWHDLVIYVDCTCHDL